jgi:large subunit ribosomal protein L5
MSEEKKKHAEKKPDHDGKKAEGHKEPAKKTEGAAAQPKAEKRAAPEAPAKKEPKPRGEKYIPRLKKVYDTEVVKQMTAENKYTSPMAVPRLVKVIINVGVGKESIEKKDASVVDSAVEEMTLIAGQKAVKTYSKKAISNFHLREGLAIGVKATLRGTRMYDFVDKLVNVALPRVRDFKGLSTSSFDGRGNYTIGLKEQLVFPEINYDKIKKVRGLDVTVVTTARTDEESLQLLKALGFPFRDKQQA